MKYSTLFFTFLFILSFSIQAQLKGTLINQKEQPVEFANVVLYSLPDSVMITGAVSDINGNFSLNTDRTDNTYLEISFIGYETQTVPAKREQTIVMKVEASELGEVIVSGSRKIFKLDNGSILASVKNTVLETLSNANEVIAQLPFLSGKDGNFTVFGKGTPIIYINNRLVQDNKELEQLSPSDIKNVRVITSPGAAYDATVKAVIKITTEKPVGDGLSGMLYVRGEQASVFSGGEYANLNYRKGAWDVFGTAFYNHHNYKTDFDATQRMFLPGNERQQVYKTNEEGGYNSLNSVIGLNFNPNNNNSAGIRYSNNNITWRGDITNDIEYTAQDVSEKIQQNSESHSPRNTHSINGYYVGEFSEKLSINLNTDIVSGNEKDNMDSYFAETPNEILKTRGERDYTLYAIKGILSYKLGKGMLDMGAEYSNTRVLQSYNINNEDLGIDNTNDKALQNRGELFTSYQTQFGQMGLNAGVRYENIVLDYYESGINNDEQSKRYNKFFPNISLSFATDNFQTVVGYERKVRYPSYRQLRSNIQYSSPFIYESGNPLLQPQIENQFSAMFAWQNLQGMMGYSINENEMQSIPQQFKDQGIILLRDENVKRSRNANIGLSYTPTFGLWRPQFEVGAMWQWLKLDNVDNSYNKPIGSAKWFNTFSLPQKWTLRVDASGRTSGHGGVTFLKPTWGIDLKVTKRFMEDKISVNLTANDILKTNTNKWEMDYGKIIMLYDKNIDSRSVILTVSYRFNSTRDKYKGQQASEEINRL